MFLVTVLLLCADNDTVRNISCSDCVSFDLDSIKKRGKLIAVTDYNSTNYFIYKGEPMGYNYELLKAFSYYLGIDIEIVTENSLERSFAMLKSGKADLLAIGLTVSSSRKTDILFTEPIEETRQVLVQRKPQNWRSLTTDDIDKMLIRNQLGLAKKTVYVQAGSSHYERLVTLAGEIGDSINVIEVPYDEEKLIKYVANGDIDYTVCDENIANVNSTYYPVIDVRTPVSFPQGLAWGVRKNNSDSLLFKLNDWIRTFKKSESYALLHSKYFNNSRSNIIVKSDYFAQNTGKVSRYDEIIKEYSKIIQWDWRLLASLICQESRFKADVKSLSGAYGLMQIMPVTGKNFGIDITSSPENNLKAGVLYINWLYSIFNPKISDEKEKINFILASYNAGPGHVLDAMALAEKNGMDPLKWEGNVAVWITKKQNPEYFNDIDVKHGYFRGTESVNFVNEILARFEHYKNIIPEVKYDSSLAVR
ncbi:MAG TPA: transporter substrate-binding domain-containing protein [Bacteroidales bacterium]|nr:transporter substrate-binding domain-containing protein [Bacteroidales bacterium]